MLDVSRETLALEVWLPSWVVSRETLHARLGLPRVLSTVHSTRFRSRFWHFALLHKASMAPEYGYFATETKCQRVVTVTVNVCSPGLMGVDPALATAMARSGTGGCGV